MLKILRKKGVAKKIIWFIAIIIIISFGFFGTASLLNNQRPSNYAGKIFGKKISFEEFERVYSHVTIQALIKYGDNFNNIREHLDLESQTWDRLIMLHEAKKRRIKVMDAEVVKAIEEYEFFQRNGKFDPSLYDSILRYVLRIKTRDFEESVRATLQFKKLYDAETSSIFPSEDAIFQSYKKINEKVQISYILVLSQDFAKQISVNEETARAYYDQNKTKFQIPSTINVEFITLPLQEIEPEPNEELSPEEAEKNTSLSDKNAEIQKANNIMREKAKDIYYESLDKPENFSQIVKNYNLETQKSGFFSEEKPNLNLGWPYEFLSMVFNFKPGEINEPFETPNAIYITKVVEKKGAYIPAFEEARQSVAQELVQIKSKEIAKKTAEEHLTAIKEELNKTKLKDFTKSAKNLGLEIRQTPVFNRGQYLPTVGLAMDFQETAFLLDNENKISDVVEIDNGYCILHQDSYIPVEKTKFEKDKAEFAKTLIGNIRNQAFNDFLVRLRLAAKLDNNLQRLRELSAPKEGQEE
ncbi:MAG: hypothetical protein A2447_11345 [Omnitrophica WOR_2 bacterium RIFOXYC2_FULL_38_12]|nr:MAG: hypothetical protein A2447_11345 [Omnitrophica WOR_2 bacterium RIFOXYC2_FULL_38_12]